MSIIEIEAAISQLPPTEVEKLKSWLDDYHERMWDQDISDDFESGRFDSLIEEAFASGDPTPLTQGDIDTARSTVKERIIARNNAQ